MGIFVYIKGYKYKLARIWSFFAFSAAIYGIGAYMVTNARDASEAFFWWQISYIGIITLPFLFVCLVYEFLKIAHPFFIKTIGFITSLFLFFDLFLPDLFIYKCTLYFKEMKWFNPIYFVFPPSFLLIFFIIFAFFGCISYAHLELINNYKKTSGLKRSQTKYFFFAAFLGFIGGGTSFLPCFGISFYPFFNFAVPLYFLILGYAIFRYRLMDISVVITRTGIFIVIYTFILGLPFALAGWFRPWLMEVIGPHWWIVPLGSMAFLATLGPFIYIYVERRAEGRLLREQKRYQQILKQASVGMTRIRNLRKLLDLITHIVTKTVRISYAAVYLYNQETNEYVLQVSRDKGRVSVPIMSSDNPLLKWIAARREPMIYEEVKRQMQDSEHNVYRLLEENMRILTASVVIPSFLEDRFMGFIVLGDKISGQIYTPEDLNVFQVLASQAALAIENAQFYDEAQEMQEQIAQAEKMATIGTMADGLSHQINNRLYALSLIAGDTIDTIKLTDTSNCTPEVKEMIKNISYALDRIQANVAQGGQVVRGLLKYSRKDDASLEAIDLNTLINNTLEMLQYKVKLSDIDIIRDYRQDTAKIKGNMAQLQEAFFNLIDNAYDAITERQKLLKEEGYRGRMVITAKNKGDFLEIVFEDNGIGLKEQNIPKVFTPFFTTKATANKGTGLGLYVIKRIITDTHKGKISFESAYKVGTRFLVELPLAK